MTKDKTQGPPKIGFGEQTADRVCADVITNPSIANEFDKWVSLCQRAGIGMSQWLAAHVSNPSSTQALTLPVAENVIGIETLTNIQAKLIADVIFYWQMNSDAIQQQFAERYATHPDPNLITAWAQMLMENFYRPDNTPLASYPKVHALLKNKVFTCNSTNGSSIISTDSDVSFTKTNGTSLTLKAGDPCQFGSEFSEFTFQDNSPSTRPKCGPNDIFCEALPRKEIDQCYNSCNCDKWPNPYEDLYSHISHARYANPDGTFIIKDGTRGGSLRTSMNDPNDGSYKVCAAHDYLAPGEPRDSSTSNCINNCNCNYTCALAQAGARYSGCYPDRYSPSPVRGQVPSGEPWPPYCAQDSHCDANSSCDLANYSCVPSGPYCEERLNQTHCYQPQWTKAECDYCLSRQTLPASCSAQIKDAYCSGGH